MGILITTGLSIPAYSRPGPIILKTGQKDDGQYNIFRAIVQEVTHRDRGLISSNHQYNANDMVLETHLKETKRKTGEH